MTREKWGTHSNLRLALFLESVSGETVQHRGTLRTVRSLSATDPFGGRVEGDLSLLNIGSQDSHASNIVKRGAANVYLLSARKSI